MTDDRDAPAWTPPAGNVSALLHARVADRAHRPLLTFYAPGERTELSYATFANWVWKAANLYAEELGLRAGDRLVTALGAHWTTVVAAVAAWHVGVAVAPGGDVPADARVVGEGMPAAADRDLPTLVVGAGPGGRVTTDSGAAVPFDEVLAFGDDYDDPAVALTGPALLVPGELDPAGGATAVLDQRNLLAAAEAAAASWGLDTGSRLLLTGDVESVRALGLGLLGAVVAGGSAVVAAGLGPEMLGEVVEAERVTGVLDPASGEGPAGGGRRGAAALRAHGPVEASAAVALRPVADGSAAWAEDHPGRWVGAVPAHSDAATLDRGGAPQPDGAAGEVAVRGPVVMAGYLDAPSDGPAGGWLPTGDHGAVAAGPDGRRHLFLTGEGA